MTAHELLKKSSDSFIVATAQPTLVWLRSISETTGAGKQKPLSSISTPVGMASNPMENFL